MSDHDIAERRSCRLIGVNRSGRQYEPLRGTDDVVRERMREIANERRRFGYRRLAVLLRFRQKQGHEPDEGVPAVSRGAAGSAQVRRPQTSIGNTGTDGDPAGAQPPLIARPFDTLRTGFASDALACGRRFRLLNGIDDYSRECLVCIVDTSLSERRVVGALTAIAERRRLPCMVVSDNPALSQVEGCTELTSHAVLAWRQDTGV